MNWIFRKLGHTANCPSDCIEGGGGCLYYESDICSAAQDFPRHLLTITIRYRVQYILLLNCIMNQNTSASVLPSYMSKAYFKISSPFTTSSSRLELLGSFPKYSLTFPRVPYLTKLIVLDLILSTVWRKVKILKLVFI